MNKIIIGLLLFLVLSTQAEIITTDKIDDIEIEFARADNETLVVFDYDDVLIEPVDLALLTINEDVSEKIADNIIKNKKFEKTRVMLALGILNRDMKIQLVHEKFPLLITALQSRGIKALMLTSCGAGRISAVDTMENTRKNNLRNFDIDFKKSWIDFHRMEFSEFPAKKYPYYTLNSPTFIDGMLFASGVDKGKVLAEFLSKIPQYKFKKIIFIDDKLKNLKSVEKISKKFGAKFIGIEYTYFKTKKRSPLDIEKAKKQYEALFTEKRWLADHEIGIMNE